MTTEVMNNSCSICLGEISEEDNLHTLGCNHSFHIECLEQWVLSNNKDTCPLCRTSVVKSTVNFNAHCQNKSIKCKLSDQINHHIKDELVIHEHFTFRKNDLINIVPCVILHSTKLNKHIGLDSIIPIFKIDIVSIDREMPINYYYYNNTYEFSAVDDFITDYHNSIYLDEYARAIILNNDNKSNEPMYYGLRLVRSYLKFLNYNQEEKNLVFYSINHRSSSFHLHMKYHLFNYEVNCLYNNIKIIERIQNYDYLLIETCFIPLMNDLFIQRYFDSMNDTKLIGQKVSLIIALLYFDIDITIIYQQICQQIDKKTFDRELKDYIINLGRPIRIRTSINKTTYDENFKCTSSREKIKTPHKYWIDKPLSFN